MDGYAGRHPTGAIRPDRRASNLLGDGDAPQGRRVRHLHAPPSYRAAILGTGGPAGGARPLRGHGRQCPERGQPATVAFRRRQRRGGQAADRDRGGEEGGARPARMARRAGAARHGRRQAVSGNRACLIVVFAQPYQVEPGGRRVNHYYVTESVGIATGLLVTAVHEAGLVSYTDRTTTSTTARDISRRTARTSRWRRASLPWPRCSIR